MRRPVKYKTQQAKNMRIALIAAASVASVGIVGGAIAAVVASGKDPDDLPDTSDTVSVSGELPGTGDLPVTDTLPVSDTESSGTAPDTEPVSEETESAETETTDTASPDVPPETTASAGNETRPAEIPDSPITEVATTKNYKGGYLALADCPTKNDLEKAAAAIRKSGSTAVMIELKYDNGRLSYMSRVENAEAFGANPSIAAHSLPDIVKIFHDAGLYVTGRVCCFRDDIAAKGNADMALMNTAGFRFSDGTSRWISAESKAGQDYILSLLREIGEAGVDEVMLRDFAFPSGVTTTKPMTDKNTANAVSVEAFLARVRKELPGLSINLELDAATIAAGQNEEAGIICDTIAKYCDSVTADLTLSNLRDGMTVGGVTIADVDADPAKTVELLLNSMDASALNIRPLLESTGDAKKDAAQIAAAKNKGYAAYQMTGRVVKMTEK